jgi:hypothetical protein
MRWRLPLNAGGWAGGWERGTCPIHDRDTTNLIAILLLIFTTIIFSNIYPAFRFIFDQHP